jgi:hypothetical protein
MSRFPRVLLSPTAETSSAATSETEAEATAPQASGDTTEVTVEPTNELTPLERSLHAEREHNRQLREQLQTIRKAEEASRLAAMDTEAQLKHYREQAAQLNRERLIDQLVEAEVSALDKTQTVDSGKVRKLAQRLKDSDEELPDSIKMLVGELKKPAVAKVVATTQVRTDKVEEQTAPLDKTYRPNLADIYTKK